MLNDSAWYGRATLMEAALFNPNPCATGRFAVLIATDLGYPSDRLRLSPEVAAMQAGEFVSRQRLTFCNVPARKGMYRLIELNQCGGFVVTQGNFALLGNGSALLGAYFPQPRQPNQVRIVSVDSAARTITGTFRATLTDSTGRVASFRKGRFVASFPKAAAPTR